MDENAAPAAAARSRGIPRPMSRLPMPKSTSIAQAQAAPSPVSAPARAPSLRPSPSVDSLRGNGGYGGRGAPASEASVSRLRPSASRERLAAGALRAPPSLGANNIANFPPPKIKSTSSVSTTAKTLQRPRPMPRPVSSLPTSRTLPQLPRSTTTTGLPRLPRDQLSTVAELDAPQKEYKSSTKLPGLRKRPSSQWISQTTAPGRDRTPSITKLSSTDSATDASSEQSPTEEEPVSDNTLRVSTPNKLGPSLAERTIETLSRLSPSPALRTRASHSTFFDTEAFGMPSRPASRRSERPESSHRPESAMQSFSRPSLSRPGSSSGPGSDFPHNSFKSQLSTIGSSPVRGRKMGSMMRTPSKVGLNGTLRSKITSPVSVRVLQSRTPSPRRTDSAVSSPSAFKQTPLPSRTVEPPAANGGFKKPAFPAKKKMIPATVPRKDSFTSQKSSTTASGEDTILSAASTATTQTVGSGDSSPQFKKASAALREQIARAKAAKRAVVQQTAAQNELPQLDGTGPAPVIPTDNTFDFGLTDDPFNLKRDAGSTSKVLQSRVAAARTSGRLNIAAMGLKEIPHEVVNMYNLDTIGGNDGSWAESVDLTRFVAADNELEMIDESLFPDVDPEELAEDDDAPMCLFGGLETLDLHGNMLISLPPGLRRLPLLNSVNLSSNRLANNCLETISQVLPLRDAKLGGNLLWGTLEPCFSRLINLEILDLHGNNLQDLPPSFADLHRLRILNLAENSFETLPFDILSQLPLTELNVRKNKLTGVLIGEGVEVLPALQTLDVSSNQLTALARQNGIIALPALTQLCVSMNRIQTLPDVSSWFELATLAADENSINALPDGFTSLEKLRSADFSSNDIRTVPAEIARMDKLTVLRLSGNPLRDRKFVSASIEELKELLAARLSPPPTSMDEHDAGDVIIAEAITSNEVSPLGVVFDGETSSANRTEPGREEDERTDTDDFATPPTSVPASPARMRSSSCAALWPVKPGGVLDRSNTQSSSLHPVVCSKLANSHDIRDVQLHHNLFATFPDSLSFFTETLMSLSLAHNQLVGETYLGNSEVLELPALRELSISSNHVTSLAPLITYLHAPSLEKLDVSVNRITSLPSSDGQLLRDAFPCLKVLLAANNHLIELHPESIRGIKIVDAANNDIAHLNPRIGLLAGVGGLERLDVMGNRFRVPRWNVLERGTEATLRWLRGRVPVAEMAAWRAEHGAGAEEETSDVD